MSLSVYISYTPTSSFLLKVPSDLSFPLSVTTATFSFLTDHIGPLTALSLFRRTSLFHPAKVLFRLDPPCLFSINHHPPSGLYPCPTSATRERDFFAFISRVLREPFVSGTWIGGTRMINIKSAVGLAKRAINRIVIAITNCYQTACGQGPLFIYRNICPWAGYTDALQTAHVTKIVSRK